MAGQQPIGAIESYHAHVYFDPEEREAAELLRDEVAAQFDVELGRWRETPVGPHTKPMYQVAFAPAVFATLVPWLMLNRRALDILVHPNTGDEVADHQTHALWLGAKLELDIGFLEAIASGDG